MPDDRRASESVARGGGSAGRRVALVTGAAQGLGEAIARSLHCSGCTVVLADVNGRQAQLVAEEIGGSARASSLQLDVRDLDALRRAFETTRERHGTVTILVNNAGVTPVAEFAELTPEEWDDVLAVNLRSAMFACQFAAPEMIATGWGRIINVTSIAGQIGSRLAGAHYSVSKGGMITLTKVVAKELAPHGVTVNAIAPAVVRAPPMDVLPQDRLGELIKAIPVRRVGEADEVAALAAFLASEHAGYITGATIDINGGQFMR